MPYITKNPQLKKIGGTKFDIGLPTPFNVRQKVFQAYHILYHTIHNGHFVGTSLAKEHNFCVIYQVVPCVV